VLAAVPHPPTPTAAAELLARADRWLRVLAGQYADRARLTTAELHHELRVDVFLAARGYDRDRGELTTWLGWRLRAVLGRLVRERRKYGREMAAAAAGCSRSMSSAELHPVDRAELVASVRSAVAGLRPGPRESISAHFGIGRRGTVGTSGDVAAALGLTQTTHCGRLGCARAQLATILAPVAERFLDLEG
jgi:hypothetical protein